MARASRILCYSIPSSVSRPIPTSGTVQQLAGFAEGGSVGFAFEALSGSEVNLSGGEIATSFDAGSGSEVNISGGVVGQNFNALSGSVVSVTGGLFERNLTAGSGSVVNVSGGVFGPGLGSFVARSGSVVQISGGQLHSLLRALPGSNVELIGGEFELNGESFGGSTITLGEEDVFTGSLQDGTAFVFGANVLNGVTLTTVPLPVGNSDPVLVDTASPDLSSFRQTITVAAGGEIADRAIFIDSTLNIQDGVVGDSVQVSDSIVDISGGVVGSINAFESEVTVSGGVIESQLIAQMRSEVNFSEGEIDRLTSVSDSVVNLTGGIANDLDVGRGKANISGGEIGEVLVFDESTVDISGGVIARSFDAFDSVINIICRSLWCVR